MIKKEKVYTEPFPCPVCGMIVEPEDICDNCGYENMRIDYDDGMRGPNRMTLTEAREAYKRGEKVE